MEKIEFVVFIKDEVYDPQSSAILDKLQKKHGNKIASIKQGKIFSIEYDSEKFSSKSQFINEISELLVNKTVENGKVLEK